MGLGVRVGVRVRVRVRPRVSTSHHDALEYARCRKE